VAPDSISHFRRVAHEFRESVRFAPPRDRDVLARELVRTLTAVYTAALALPDPDYNSPEVEQPAVRRSVVLSEIAEVLGGDDVFREVWHPFERDTPIEVSISQQLAEIYYDLDEAEDILAEHGASPGALYEVSWAFQNHWGKHAVDVLRALHHLAYGPPA
jgi:hypothetical protein